MKSSFSLDITATVNFTQEIIPLNHYSPVKIKELIDQGKAQSTFGLEYSGEQENKLSIVVEGSEVVHIGQIVDQIFDSVDYKDTFLNLHSYEAPKVEGNPIRYTALVDDLNGDDSFSKVILDVNGHEFVKEFSTIEEAVEFCKSQGYDYSLVSDALA